MAGRSKSISLDLTSAKNGNDAFGGLLRTPSLPSSSGIAESTKALFLKLDKLDDQEGNELRSSLSNSYYHIRKVHWVDLKQVNKCHLCNKQFSFSSKKHNCRRCGRVFCDVCCQYRRRLSKDAEPDSNGNLYRVCYQCAELNVQGFGQTRSLTAYFDEQRRNKRVNVLQELERLLNGFQANIKSSRIKSYLTETISVVKVPDWQKGYKWVESSEVEWCCNCAAKFTYIMQKSHCRICGVVVCSKCSDQDLMLYYDRDGSPKWTLIRVVGCPDSEPSVCLYLSVCRHCREEIEEFQVERFYGDSVDASQSSDQMEILQVILNRLSGLENRILANLPRYQELVESLMDGKKLNEIAGSGQNVVQIFAKLQLDLSDMFVDYSVTVQGLKKFKMITRTEVKVMRNIIDIKCSFYRNNMSLFKSLKDNLSKSLPSDALQEVQDYSNKQSINNACVIIKQLGHEALMLAESHHFEPSLAAKLSEVDEVCTSELKELILALNGNWDEHFKQLKELLKIQLTGHRLVIPPKSSRNRNRSEFVKSFLLDRSLAILTQTSCALQSKSSEKKFALSKEAVSNLVQTLEVMQKATSKWVIPSE